MAATYHHELRGPLPEQLGMPQPRLLPMIERTRRRASFCLTSMRNARRMGFLQAKGQGSRDLCFRTPTHRGDVQALGGPGKAGPRLLCSLHALVASTEVG